MEFSYKSYSKLLNTLKQNGFVIVDYKNANASDVEKKVILRHDVDNCLKKATQFAQLEYDHNVQSTYFVLPRSGFYNLFSPESKRALFEIIRFGHHIGLHFDESNYHINSVDEFHSRVLEEKTILELAINQPIHSISMHRPSRFTLDSDLEFDGLINSYSQEFFHYWKYISDSRMHWREDVLGTINNSKHHQLHILTHPFWYYDNERSISAILKDFITRGNKERYRLMDENFRDLSEFVKNEEV